MPGIILALRHKDLVPVPREGQRLVSQVSPPRPILTAGLRLPATIDFHLDHCPHLLDDPPPPIWTPSDQFPTQLLGYFKSTI